MIPGFHSALRTIFIDGDEEKEGENILYNLALMAGATPGATVSQHLCELSSVEVPVLTTVLNCNGAGAAYFARLDQFKIDVQRCRDAYRFPPRQYNAEVSQRNVNAAQHEIFTKSNRGSNAPCRDARVLRYSTNISQIDLETRMRQSQAKRLQPVECTRCGLRNDLSQVSVVEPLFGVANPNRQYPIALGLMDEQQLIDRLWGILARAQFSDELKKRSRDQRAEYLKKHFEARVGVPPWAEYFFRRKRQEGHALAATLAQHNNRVRRLAHVQSKTAAAKLELAALETAMSVRNPTEHAAQVGVTLQTVNAQVKAMEQEDEQTQEKLQQLNTLLNRYAEKMVVEIEECRRCIAVVHELQNAAETVAASSHIPTLSKENCARVLHAILEKFPSAALSEELELQLDDETDDDDDDPDNPSHDPKGHMCNDCLLLKNFSKYCPMTGKKHEAVRDRPASSGSDDDDRPEAVLKQTRMDTDDNALDLEMEKLKETDFLALTKPTPPSEAFEAFDDNDFEAQETQDFPNLDEDSPESPSLKVKGRRRKKTGGSKPVVPSSRSESKLNLKIGRSFTKVRAITTTAFKKTTVETVEATAEEKEQALQNAKSAVAAGRLDPTVFGVLLSDQKANDSVETEQLWEHLNEFLRAAGDKDVTQMRTTNMKLQAEISNMKTPVARGLNDAEMQFTEWFALMLLRLNTDPQKQYRDTINITTSARPTDPKDHEALLRTLAKDLRNLTYSFQKRPKGKSLGANLDDESFKTLAARISELERRSLFLKTRVKLAASEKRMLDHRLHQAKGEYFLSRAQGSEAKLDPESAAL